MLMLIYVNKKFLDYFYGIMTEMKGEIIESGEVNTNILELDK